jgi:hypothetical protein
MQKLLTVHFITRKEKKIFKYLTTGQKCCTSFKNFCKQNPTNFWQDHSKNETEND